MQQYKNLIRDIMTNGRRRGDRTGTGTLSVFGRQLTFDLQDGFPLVTLKRTPFHLIIAELIWFLEGSTDNRRLRELSGVSGDQRGIWDDWAVTDAHCSHNPITIDGDEVIDTRRIGSLGPIYGQQFRNWRWLVDINDRYQRSFDIEQADQISILINGLKQNPYSRRHIVSAWNVADLPDESRSPQQNVLRGKMALAPCHAFFQCYVRDMTMEERIDYYNDHMDKVGLRMGVPDDVDTNGVMEMLDKLGVPKHFLDLQLYQRSLDTLVGGPFNIASYALLTHMLARECGYVPGEFVWTLGDAHIYQNQLDEVDVILTRDIRPLPSFELPASFNMSHILDKKCTRQDVLVLAGLLQGYDPHPAIKIAVAT